MTPLPEGQSVPEGFGLPHNTEWTVADAWGLTKRQCQNISYRTEIPKPKPKRPPPALTSHVWTEDAVDTLKRLWTFGASCSQIAKHLGTGFTKNSVLGKARRIGLPPRKYQAPRRVA